MQRYPDRTRFLGNDAGIYGAAKMLIDQLIQMEKNIEKPVLLAYARGPVFVYRLTEKVIRKSRLFGLRLYFRYLRRGIRF